MTSRITEADLLYLLNDRDRQTGTTAHCTLRQYQAALFTLDYFLGYEWLEAHVFPRSKNTPFLHPANVNWQDQYKHQDRVVSLAEILFNLQDTEGFANRVQRIRTGDVETTLGKLEGARLLYMNGVPFRFVPEKGIAGEDYDVEAILDSRKVPCEIKTKLEATELTVETVRNTLETARRQLPSESLGIVFFKVPEIWTQQPKGLEIVQEALRGFFRNTRRVALVILHWEQWIRFAPDLVVRAVKFRPELNPKPGVTLPTLGDLIKGIDSEQYPRLWRSFAKLLCHPEEIFKSTIGEQALILSTTQRWPPPVQGIGVRYDGDLEQLRAEQPGNVITVVDFECEGFELFSSSPEAQSCKVTLPNHEITSFSVYCREKQSLFQIQLPGLIYDTGLITHNGATIVPVDRTNRMQERLQAGIGHPDEVDEDEFLRKLRAVFAAMRVEGDLTQSVHELRALSVTYWIKSENASVFAARYFGRGIKV